MRVVLIESDDGDDGRGLATARALRARGHEVTLVVPQTALQPQRPRQALAWQAEGFACLPVGAGHLPPNLKHYPRDPRLQTTRALAEIVLTFDACWFFEPEWALQAVRERRFRLHALPLIVLDLREEKETIPHTLADINRTFAQQYSARWADRVFDYEEVDRHSMDARVREVEQLWQQHTAAPARVVCKPATTPAITVCMPYFEEPQFLPQALRSLASQTSQDFTVVVVDDGSPSQEAQAVFASCCETYADRGWKFIRHTNSSPGGAKNRAAAEASTEFLVFLDADDLATPQMIERFLYAALLTGDDCLVARNYAFRDDPDGPCTMLYDPPGNSLIGSMGDDMHGGSAMIFRREALLSLGGFTEMRGVGFDDYELHIRANLSGLRWDVFPEFVYRYRSPRGEGVSSSTSAYLNLARVTRLYRARLQPYELGQLPLAFASTYWANEHNGEVIDHLTRTLTSRRASRSPRGRDLKLLLLACNFPFEMSSGWHNRVQQMVRYFGSRYQLTLMTSMPREMLAAHRKQAFANLHAVLGVEGSSRSAIDDPAIPFRVREHYTDVYKEALEKLPTDQYHAAILDQVFMAEFRRNIDTLPVLTEHNIESRLLRQAAERTWTSELPLHYRNAMQEADLLERYEDSAWQDFPLRAAVSEADRDVMQCRAPNGVTVIAPNGADPSSWIENARFDSATVLFSGHLAYLPNVDAVQFLLAEIWPLVRRQIPNARLIVAGRSPSSDVKAAVKQWGADMGVRLVADPDSMDVIARKASVTVAPLRLGSGTRIKILESMAWGLPVVSTTLGAEGIAIADGEHALLRDDADAFAEAIVQLLRDQPLWQKLRQNARELVRERYTWERVFEPLETALLELIP